MDFSKTNIQKILKSAMGKRFSDFSPQDFEDFIAYLFISNSYDVEQTKYSGDYGVDLIINKDGINKAVQVKRFQEKNKVGVKDINQVRGGSEYYKCKESLIITTSSFTKPAINLAHESSVELWDWNTLQKCICDTFLDGKDYYEYFRINQSPKPKGNNFSFLISRIQYNVSLKRTANGTMIYIKISNNSEKNLYIDCSLPTYITLTNNQYEATGYLHGYFSIGKIYAGCTVEACFIFEYDQLSRVQEGDKLIVTLDIDHKKTKTFSIYMKRPEVEVEENKCFVATAAFGSSDDSTVIILKKWRDRKLKESKMGILFIRYYYSLSPRLAAFIKNKKMLKKFTRLMLRALILLLKRNYD